MRGDQTYEATDDVRNEDGDTVIRKGDRFYLDKSHGDHLEVFDKWNNDRPVVNLDGSINIEKTIDAKGRTINR